MPIQVYCIFWYPFKRPNIDIHVQLISGRPPLAHCLIIVLSLANLHQRKTNVNDLQRSTRETFSGLWKTRTQWMLYKRGHTASICPSPSVLLCRSFSPSTFPCALGLLVQCNPSSPQLVCILLAIMPCCAHLSDGLVDSSESRLFVVVVNPSVSMQYVDAIVFS